MANHGRNEAPSFSRRLRRCKCITPNHFRFPLYEENQARAQRQNSSASAKFGFCHRRDSPFREGVGKPEEGGVPQVRRGRLLRSAGHGDHAPLRILCVMAGFANAPFLHSCISSLPFLQTSNFLIHHKNPSSPFRAAGTTVRLPCQQHPFLPVAMLSSSITTHPARPSRFPYPSSPRHHLI